MAVKCTCGIEHTDWVPASRLSEVSAERTTAMGTIADLERKIRGHDEAVTAIKTEWEGKVGTLTEQVQTWTSKAEGWEVERGALRAGITDPEGLSVVSALWSTVPADKRPEGGVSAWLGSETAPRAVRAYMPAATPTTGAETGTPTGTPGTPTGTPAPKTLPASQVGATGTPAPAGSAHSAEAISAMSTEQYREHRAAILAASRA